MAIVVNADNSGMVYKVPNYKSIANDEE